MTPCVNSCRRLAIALCAKALLIAPQALTSNGPYFVSLDTTDGRVTEVRIVPGATNCSPCDVVVFSHGFNLAHDQYDKLIDGWSKDGYVVVAPLHVDSEKHPDKDEYSPAETLEPRLDDWAAVIAALHDGSVLGGKEFSGRYLAAGHSYGALIAQFAGGARAGDNTPTRLNDLELRPVGIVAVSPPGPVPGHYSASGWSYIDVPHLIVTGTRDIVPGIAPAWEDHLASYEATDDALGFALVFDGMDHYFNGSFGREAVTLDDDASAATATLHRLLNKFSDASFASKPIAPEAWRAFSSSTVEALCHRDSPR